MRPAPESATPRSRRAPDAQHDPPPPESPPHALPRVGEITLRVRYAECDPQGVAHHSAYAPWLELARTELLRGEKTIDPETGFPTYAGGVDYAAMERAGVFLVVAKIAIAYKAPARYDEHLTVTAAVVGGGRARLDHDYAVYRCKPDGSKGELLTTASTTLACVDHTGRPRPLPDWLRADAMRSG
jgi:acyl-CoA thioester hydrolase